MTGVWRLGRRVPLNVYGEPTDQWPQGRPICQCHTTEDAQRIVDAVNWCAHLLDGTRSSGS